MKLFQNRQTALVVAIALLTPMLLWAQTEKETLVVGEITATEGIGSKHALEFKQILGTFKGALETSLQKKFSILSRNLKAINMEAAVSGDVELKKAKYILLTTVTGFVDGSADNPGEAGVAHTRTIKIWGTAQISKLNGETLTPTDFSVTNHMGQNMIAGIALDEKFGDELVEQAPKDAAKQIAGYVLSEISTPPEVINVDDKIVTIDWGKAMPIAKGDTWEVCTQINRTNSGGVIFSIKKPIGKITIQRVDDDNSTGVIVGENPGIVEGCVLRRPQ